MIFKKTEENILDIVTTLKPLDYIEPNGINEIRAYAFYRVDLLSIVIPEGVIKIDEGAFMNQNLLTTIILPTTIEYIGIGAFTNCGSLISIEITESVIEIGCDALIHSFNLTIYCENEEQPNAWDINWNSSNAPVVWDYKNK